MKCRLFSLILLTVLSACSVTRHSQQHTQKSRKHKTTSTNPSSELVFINHIKNPQDKKNSSHKIDAYHQKEKISTEKEITSLQKKFSQFLEVTPPHVIHNPKLWSFINNWWGTPYRYGGSTKKGIDCSAFSQTLYDKVYQINSLPRTARAQFKTSIKIKRIKDLQPGDLVFFKIHSRYISHVGIYLQNDKFVSATSSSGVTISDLTDAYWKRYYVGGGRPRD